ncbi:hypothetical protein SJI45_15240 [Streptomyces sp. S399]|uniref:hypothetical protein n=1 Tax=Streptomyces sp. S399 TaxID=3096009 RepID=UPI002A80F98E|nr:hypothetical protein [Streptomyces sp. S399]WPR52197.1 hypothetical protein SJI45_15240 [Streptomyces sp. S399]
MTAPGRAPPVAGGEPGGGDRDAVRAPPAGAGRPEPGGEPHRVPGRRADGRQRGQLLVDQEAFGRRPDQPDPSGALPERAARQAVTVASAHQATYSQVAASCSRAARWARRWSRPSRTVAGP